MDPEGEGTDESPLVQAPAAAAALQEADPLAQIAALLAHLTPAGRAAALEQLAKQR